MEKTNAQIEFEKASGTIMVPKSLEGAWYLMYEDIPTKESGLSFQDLYDAETGLHHSYYDLDARGRDEYDRLVTHEYLWNMLDYIDAFHMDDDEHVELCRLDNYIHRNLPGTRFFHYPYSWSCFHGETVIGLYEILKPYKDKLPKLYAALSKAVAQDGIMKLISVYFDDQL